MPLLQASSSSLPPILRLSEVDSTNAEAMRRALGGEAGPLWIVAGRQREGRGRSGRRWSSEPGNLHASCLMTLSSEPCKAYQLSLVAGVAVVDAVRQAMTLPEHAPLRLKWPNDILIGRAKAGGILVESGAAPAGLIAVVGVGVNLVQHPEGLDRPATHLAAYGRAPDPDRLLGLVATALSHWLGHWDEGRGFAAVREAWLARAGNTGERMSVHTGGGVVAGAFAGIDPDGALLLRDDLGGEHRYTYGDVSLAG